MDKNSRAQHDYMTPDGGISDKVSMQFDMGSEIFEKETLYSKKGGHDDSGFINQNDHQKLFTKQNTTMDGHNPQSAQHRGRN